MKKVKVWQLGYQSCKDYVIGDREKAVCKEMGYVLVPNDAKDWDDDVWHLLNWACWNYDEELDRAVKPEEVHSPLDHCNSDIILQIEGKSVFRCCLSFGWDTAYSLEDAIRKMKNGATHFWTFAGVRGCSGYTKVKDGKAYIAEKYDGEYKEITW